MYKASDISIPRVHGKGTVDRQIFFSRFMGLIRPWITIAGSALDVEEAMLEAGLPTDRHGWVNMGEREIDTAMAIAEFFHAFSKAGFKFPGTNVGVYQIGPAIGPYRSVKYQNTVPLQIAIETGARKGFAADNVLFANDTALANGAVAWNIDTVNAAVRAAGLLKVGENAIERGQRRVVIRPEFFRYVKGASAVSAATRNQVPYISTLTVNLRATTIAGTSGSGALPSIGAVITGGTSGATATVLDVSGNLASHTLYLGSITGTFQAETITSAGYSATCGGAQVSTTSLSGGAVTVKDYLRTVVANSLLWQYPNHRADASSAIATPLAADVQAVARYFHGGDPANSVVERKPASRSAQFGRIAHALRLYAGFMEQVGRGTITSVGTTDDALRADLVAKGLPSLCADLLKGGTYDPELSHLALAHCRLYGVSGGLLAAIDGQSRPQDYRMFRPDVHNVTQARHIFVMRLMAYMAQIEIDHAADPTTFPGTVADLAKFGWLSAESGNAIVNAAALSALDPKLYELYLSHAALVVGGYVPSYKFRAYAGQTIGQTVGAVLDGNIWIKVPTTTTVEGAATVAAEVHIQVPSLGSNLKSGGFILRAPPGLVFTSATWQGSAPDTTAVLSGTGTNQLSVLFSDATGYAAGDKRLVNVVLTPSKALGSVARGAPISGSLNGAFLAVGNTTDFQSRFSVIPTYVVTELV